MNFKRYKNAEPRFLCRDLKYCGNASCLASIVLDEVERVLLEAIEDFRVRIEAGTDDSLEVHRQLVKRLEKRLADLEALELAQWEKYTTEGMPKHIFDQLNEKVLTDKAEVQEALCVAREAAPEPVDYQAKEALFSELLELMKDPDAPVEGLNVLFKACIERITYSRPRKPGTSEKWGNAVPVTLDIKLRV